MWKGIEFESVTVDLGAGEQLSEAHLARNPLGRVPALWLPGVGGCLAESVAILEYLEETDPSRVCTPRIPGGARACASSWST